LDTVTVTLSQTLPLTVTGRTSAKAFMAANAGFLFIATNRSTFVDEIDTRRLTITPLGPYSSNFTSVTADQYGYVTVADGSESTVFGPDGSGQSGGGGTDLCRTRFRVCRLRFLRLLVACPSERLREAAI